MKSCKSARSTWLPTVMTIGFLGLAGSTAAAGEAQKPTAAVDVQENAQAAVSAPNSMRAYIDPTTGQLRQPTPEELAAEAQQTVSAAAATDGKVTGVEFVTRADGTRRALDTEGRMMESVLATRNTDGTVSYSFVGGDGAQAHQEPATATTAEQK